MRFNKFKSSGFGRPEHKQPIAQQQPAMALTNNTTVAKGGTVYQYQKPKFEMPAKDIPNCYVHPLLQLILETKRPTKDATFCLDFISNLLTANNISHSIDKAGNVTVEVDVIDEVEGEFLSEVCFTSHTDTVDNKLGTNKLEVKGNLIYVKDGGVLGADCGTGMYIMIRMILEKVPGHYVFFASEEVGRVGSKQYDMPAHITKCISFDRKGYDNLITTQSGTKGCSDTFADALIAGFKLPLVKDPTGSYTDSYTFFDSINECINLSVGYFNQHTQNEYQDLEHLALLVDACIKLDWEDLPAERDPIAELKKQSFSYGYGRSYFDDCDYDYDYDYNHRYNTAFSRAAPPRSEKVEIEDFCFNNYYVVAEMLMDYGLTIRDCEAYKADIDAVRRARAESLSSKK